MSVSAPHIAYLVQDFPPEVGAGPARVTEMARRWQELEARVTVITGMPNRRLPGRGAGRIDPRYRGKLFLEESWEGIRTLRSWVFASRSHGFAAKMANNASFMFSGFAHALSKVERPDVLIASSPPFLPHIAGALLSRYWRTPLILEIRDLWPDYLEQMGILSPGMTSSALFRTERWLLRQAAHVVVVTESFRKRIVEKGVTESRISVVPNGVDTREYRPTTNTPPPLEALVRRDGDFIVGYMGTFGRGQSLLTIIEVAESLASADANIRFVLVGDGSDREMLRAAMISRGMRNVAILPPIPRSETAAFYNSCDVCLVPLAPIPILQETVPSKIFEIMACGRPLVASAGGETARIVQQSGGGITAEPGNAAQIRAAVLRVRAMSRHEMHAMGARAREYVVRHYDRRVLADRYLDLIRGIGARERGAPNH